jgi:hypothetical protein
MIATLHVVDRVADMVVLLTVNTCSVPCRVMPFYTKRVFVKIGTSQFYWFCEFQLRVRVRSCPCVLSLYIPPANNGSFLFTRD